MGERGPANSGSFGLNPILFDIKNPDLEEPPFVLSKSGRAIYQSVGALLLDCNVLTELDTFALARYAAYCAEWLECQKKIAETGGYSETLVNSKGATYRQKLDEASRIKELEGVISRLEKQLGLTPAARGGKTGGEPRTPGRKGNGNDDEDREFLFGE